jgi:hypothetical protein
MAALRLAGAGDGTKNAMRRDIDKEPPEQVRAASDIRARSAHVDPQIRPSLPGLTWLDPAIHPLKRNAACILAKKMDPRVKPAGDECRNAAPMAGSIVAAGDDDLCRSDASAFYQCVELRRVSWMQPHAPMRNCPPQAIGQIAAVDRVTPLGKEDGVGHRRVIPFP